MLRRGATAVAVSAIRGSLVVSPRPLLGPQRTSRSFLTIVKEYEQGVMLTLGKYTGTKGPGIRICIPIVQEMFKVDMRERPLETLYYQVEVAKNVGLSRGLDTTIARDLQAFVVRLVSGNLLNSLLHYPKSVEKILTDGFKREMARWDVVVKRVKLSELRIETEEMRRALAKEAEATRDRKVAFINADAENQSSEFLSAASKMMEQSEAAIELRRLRAIEQMATEKQPHVLVVPMDLFNPRSSDKRTLKDE